MWRPGLEVVGTIVLLELLAAGGVKGGQNQGKAGDLAEAGVISVPEPEWPSANSETWILSPFHTYRADQGEMPRRYLGSEINHLC